MERLLNAADAPLVLSERDTASGHVVAFATLNVAKTLNSLTLGMIDTLAAQLPHWRASERVVALVIRGAGDRALAAGGDIQALYHSVVRNHQAGARIDDYDETFFAREYRLDFDLHQFGKPVVAWGNGVVMGGGLGLLGAASHRIVTEKVRIAFPEITIGLFPDAGGTWLLARQPRAIALWIGLSGCQMNSGDALELGLATHCVPHARREAFEQALLDGAWRGEAAADHAGLDRLLAAFDDRSAAPASAIAAARPALEAALDPVDSLPAAVAAMQALQGSADPWLAQGARTLLAGCPTTAGIVIEQVRRAAGLTLAQCFQLELVIATHCARNPEFAEGVRALLIDKDNAPAWRHPDPLALPEGWIAGHFVAPWDHHPLADLG